MNSSVCLADKSKSRGDRHRMSLRLSTKLPLTLCQIHGHGGRADTENIGRLFCRKAASRQSQYLKFALAKFLLHRFSASGRPVHDDGEERRPLLRIA